MGFSWFAARLYDGTCCFGGEESAGGSFLKQDGSVWTTDKDGLLLGLLAAEMIAHTGKDPGQLYGEITAKFGTCTIYGLTPRSRLSRKPGSKSSPLRRSP